MTHYDDQTEEESVAEDEAILPIYLEPDVDEFMNKLAEAKDVDVQRLVNEWLRTNIKLIESTL